MSLCEKATEGVYISVVQLTNPAFMKLYTKSLMNLDLFTTGAVAGVISTRWKIKGADRVLNNFITITNLVPSTTYDIGP